MINNDIFPVILCGGTGTRLWPLSRESYPKQYLPMANVLSAEFNPILKPSKIEKPTKSANCKK